MVCLTTFDDTKRVISHSLIIFHTFYGHVRDGVCSLKCHTTSHLPYPTPSSQLPTSLDKVILFLLSQSVIKQVLLSDEMNTPR